MLEAELKAALEGRTLEELEAAARAMGFCPRQVLRETDLYFNGVDRNFAQTDEALRLRSVQQLEPAGEAVTCLTYKGPKQDVRSNSRTEYETAVAEGETARKLLEALGYRPVCQVEKVRRELTLEGVTLCLDRVTGLGEFLELELLCGEEEREAAVERLLSVLDALGVPRTALLRRSYLGMLLEKMGQKNNR